MTNLKLAPSPFSLKYPQHQHSWDSVSLKEFKTCPRKYYYRIVLGYTSPRISPHLTFGLIYHSSLELYDIMKAKGAGHDEAVSYTLQHLLTKTWDRELSRPSFDSEEPTKTRETLIRSILWYLAKFKDDPCKTVLLHNNKPAVELSFNFETDIISGLTGEYYILSGHLDRLVEFEGGLYILDRKTTKAALTDYFIKSFSPDIQMTLYYIAGGIVLNRPIQGLLIDAVQVGVNFSRFGRFVITRSQKQLDEFIKDLEYFFSFAEHCAKEEYWPMNECSCSNYGGCPYRNICTEEPYIRIEYLKNEFLVSKWNPLEVR